MLPEHRKRLLRKILLGTVALIAWIIPTIISLRANTVSNDSVEESRKNNELSQRALKTHIDPQLACFLDGHPEKENFLLFTLKNEGTIDATTVSVDHITMRYDKEERLIRFYGADGGPVILRNDPGVRWIYRPQLAPNDAVAKLTGEFATSSINESAIDVLLFEVAFLRDTDGQQYKKRCIYFLDRGEVYTNQMFREHEHFEYVDAEVDRHLNQGFDFGSPNTRTRQ